MLSIPVLVVIAVILLVIYTIKENKKRPLNFPPGPPSLPVYGGYWLVLKENLFFPHKAFVSLHKKYKSDVIGFYMGNRPTVTCYKHNLLKQMLVREEFVGRTDTLIARNKGRGKLIGIFFADGEYWKDQRWFSLRHMRDYGFGRRDISMENWAGDEIRNLLDFFQSKPKAADSDVCTERGIVLMPDVMYGHTINTLQHTLSATHFEDYKYLRDVGRACSRFLNSIDSTGNAICVTSWLKYIAPEYFGWNSSIRDIGILIEFAKKIVDEHFATFKEDHLRDFVDVYMKEMNYLKENGKTNTSFSEAQLINTVADYMLPAPVDIGHTFNLLFATLIDRVDVQQKIQTEIDAVIGRARLPTLDDRKNLHYTEATLREIIRKETLVPLSVARRATKDTIFGGYFIPKDTMILPNIYGMHNDAKQWGDPEVFRPDRFLESDGTLSRKDNTLGFGAGKRLCAGETFARNTMFIFFSGIMQNFTLKCAPGKPKPNLQKQINGLNVYIPSYYMMVEPRKYNTYI